MFNILAFSVLALGLVGTICLASPLSIDAVHQNDIGSLPSHIFEQFPRLAYVGIYKGKEWYIDRTNISQYAARYACQSMNMTLARFDYNDELQFIANRTTSEDNMAWTDGEVIPDVSSYSWGSLDLTPIPAASFGLNNNDRIGLTLGRHLYPFASRFITADVFSLHYYICYFATNKITTV